MLIINENTAIENFIIDPNLNGLERVDLDWRVSHYYDCWKHEDHFILSVTLQIMFVKANSEEVVSTFQQLTLVNFTPQDELNDRLSVKKIFENALIVGVDYVKKANPNFSKIDTAFIDSFHAAYDIMWVVLQKVNYDSLLP